MYYITILNFANSTVDQYDLLDYNEEEELASWQSENFENFLVSEGYNLSNIEWMSHSDNTIYKY
jgi:hypothetical protein